MAAATNKLVSTLAAKNYLDDPADATVVRQIGWVAMAGADAFLALCTFISGTGVLTFKIFAASDSSGTGAVVVKAHATPTTADAAGDQLVLEVSPEEVLAVLAHASHVSVQMDNSAAGDVNLLTYVRRMRDAQDALTADVIA